MLAQTIAHPRVASVKCWVGLSRTLDACHMEMYSRNRPASRCARLARICADSANTAYLADQIEELHIRNCTVRELVELLRDLPPDAIMCPVANQDNTADLYVLVDTERIGILEDALPL